MTSKQNVAVEIPCICHAVSGFPNRPSYCPKDQPVSVIQILILYSSDKFPTFLPIKALQHNYLPNSLVSLVHISPRSLLCQQR